MVQLLVDDLVKYEETRRCDSEASMLGRKNLGATKTTVVWATSKLGLWCNLKREVHDTGVFNYYYYAEVRRG